jgi:hypothetical protein
MDTTLIATNTTARSFSRVTRKCNETRRSDHTGKYILDAFEPTHRITILALHRGFRETVQRITSAEKAVSPDFQAWLRHKNANGSDIYVTWNRT